MVAVAFVDPALDVLLERAGFCSMTIIQAMKTKSFFLNSFESNWNGARFEIGASPQSMRTLTHLTGFHIFVLGITPLFVSCLTVLIRQERLPLRKRPGNFFVIFTTFKILSGECLCRRFVRRK